MSAALSRRGVMALGLGSLGSLGVLLTSHAGVPASRAVSPPSSPTWLLAESNSPMAMAWLQATAAQGHSRALVMGEGDLYAWWREARREAEQQGQVLRLQGLTRWAAFSFVQTCAREAGWRLHCDARHDLRGPGATAALPAVTPAAMAAEPPGLLLSWHLG